MKTTYSRTYTGHSIDYPNWNVFQELFDLIWGEEFHDFHPFKDTSNYASIKAHIIDSIGNTHSVDNLEELATLYKESDFKDFSIWSFMGPSLNANIRYNRDRRRIFLKVEGASNNEVEKPLQFLEKHFPKNSPTISIIDRKSYIDTHRLDEIRKLRSADFDFTRLIVMCDELNAAYSRHGYISTIFLVRAILDHVPPLFKKLSFTDVASQYGTKSFQDSMKNLDNSSRKIADSNLHTHIQRKEVLPNSNQVDFIPAMDVLLSEIIKLYS